MIPKQLKHLSFCRIKKGEKAPFEKEWTIKPYTYDEISEFFPNENYGVLCGYHELAVIDCDKEELKIVVENLLPETFAVKTGGGGTHFYYFIPKLEKKIILDAGEHLGEIQSKGAQVVGSGSIHPNGNTYEIINNLGIKEISLEELTAILGQFMKKETEQPEENVEEYNNLVNEIVKAWKVGDRQELALSVSGYLRKEKRMGINKVKAIVLRVCQITEDEEIKMRLRAVDETFKKDEKDIKGWTGLKGKVDVEKGFDELEIYTHEQLREYVPRPYEWIIENQIPRGEVGLLVGKRGERKTFVALYLALCAASGKKAFDRDEVPEKKKILIIDEESGINELAKRIQALERGLEISENLDIKYISFSGIKLNNNNSKTLKIIDDFQPDLIIVDCLQRVVSFEVDKDNAAISEFFTEIVRPTIKKYGSSWLFIHHLRKSPPAKYNPEDVLDEVRGGSELVNYCRYVLLTQLPKHEAKENIDLVVFRVVKMSNAPIPDPMVISFETNNGSIKVAYEGLPKDILSAEVRAAHLIKEWLFAKQIIEFRTKDLQDACEEIGAKKTLLSYGLNFLLKQGAIERVKRGYWCVTASK